MDTKTSEIFFELLRAGLWGRKADLRGACPDAAQWTEFLRAAREQTVTGAVFDGMATLPAECMPPREVKFQFAADVAVIEDRSARMRKALRAAAEILDANKLPYILLKGMAVADAYPTPDHRVSGDIDLWLTPEDCEKTPSLLFPGQQVLRDKRHISGQFKGVHFENHFELSHTRSERYLAFSREILGDDIRLPLSKVTADGYDITCPSPTFHALFILEHLAFHLVNGLGLRQICDWAVFLQRHAAQIDRMTAERILCKYGFTRITAAYTLICIDHLGMPEACALQPVDRSTRAKKDADFILRMVLEGGNFGRHYSPKYSLRAHLKLPFWHRKYRSALIVVRNYHKYKLISRKLYWEYLVRMLRKQVDDE